MSSPSKALSALYEGHHRWLYTWLYRRLGCSEVAADLAHDTFLRVLVRDRQAGSIKEPRSYLATIARGLSVDHLRRKKLEQAFMQAISELPESEVPNPEVQCMVMETLIRVDRLLNGLKPRVRTAFLMSRVDGMSYPEIARALGVSLSSVEKYMACALLHCLKALD
ncbi:RNA polymerase subunit sigma [Ectothiorhodospira shaposhnikovii]|uniref:sigma-70 family RNA polymerase sigma factor n=1 Tax=Ectothiorhodospira shaposhnikovii TaxID=1054 RepID=UPI001905F27A|nr:sigma-70 family RNA polymerase sigma factor [Ectothiorhodospira shaposhnikovii]MBK1674307.1 RNA polymerase subunit sigma [Ectothiorhodospira shaposhnikovii]